MDRLFLDANVLFSAAYRGDAAVKRLWADAEAELVTSTYALAEVERNLGTTGELERLSELLEAVTVVGVSAIPAAISEGIDLPEKDLPILAGALAARCTHLITGDLRHFGRYLGTRIGGVLVVTPAAYLREGHAGPRPA